MAKKTKEELLELRRKQKAKKPTFIRDDSFKVKRVSSPWRRPKGLQAKLRLRLRSAGRYVSPGFGSPAAVRGLDRSGLEPVLVHNATQLQSLDAKTQGAVLASTVGARKKIELIKLAQEKKIALLNLKDAEAFVKKAEEAVKSRKQSTEKKQAERKSKREAAAKKKESLEKKVEKDKKDAEKKDASDDKKTDKPAEKKPAAEAKKDAGAAKPAPKKEEAKKPAPEKK